MGEDNSLQINIEAIDDASEVLQGVADTATELAGQMESVAKEMNGSLQTISTSALDMSTSVDEATASAGEGLLAMGEDAMAMADGADAAFVTFGEGIATMGSEATASMNELNAVMATESTSISEDAIAMGTSWDEAAAMVAGANAEIAGSSESTQGGMAGLAAALLLVSQYLKQMSNAVNSEIGNAYQATGNWNQSLLELNQTLQNSKSSIPVSELTEFTKQMQSTTLFQQEAVLQSENLVMTHKDLQGSYQQIIGLSADLATKMAQATGGTANLGNATRLLTNAFSDPATTMNQLIRQAGIDIPYAMQQAITKTTKAGDTAAAAALLMRELNTQIGGLAVASAQASGTGMTKLANDFASMQQNMPGLTQAIDDLALVLDKMLMPLAQWVNDHPKLTATILLSVAAMLAFAATLTGIIALVILFAIGVAAGISGTMVLVGLAITAAIGAVVALGVAIALNWQKIVALSQTLWADFKAGFKEALDYVINLFEGWYSKVMGWINSIIDSMKSIASSIGNGVHGAVSVVGGAISNLIPHFAAGGIVNGPTMALVGEAGPEAIIPLSQLGGGAGYGPLPSGIGGGGITINVVGQVLTTEQQARNLGDMLAKIINRQQRLSSFK